MDTTPIARFSKALQDEILFHVNSHNETIEQEIETYGESDEKPYDLTKDSDLYHVLHNIEDKILTFRLECKDGYAEESPKEKKENDALLKEIRLWYIEKGAWVEVKERSYAYTNGKRYSCAKKIDGRMYEWAKHL